MTNNVAPVQKTNGLAIAALITGIVGVSILGVIFGHISLSQIKTRNEGGKGMAIAGLVLGYVGIAGWIFWIIIFAAAAASNTMN
jgi:peptidyl-prolyl cis-trans isomerase B (cyclophilin B)